MPQSSEQPTFRCGSCASTFVRREHLNRHTRTHTKEKPFQCSSCGKAFARADILRRHEQSHASDENGTGKNLKRGTTFRACIACASSRVRCSGGARCHGCEKKGLNCKYPTTLARKPKPSSTQSSSIPGMDRQKHTRNDTPGRTQAAEMPFENVVLVTESNPGSQIVASLATNSVADHSGAIFPPASTPEIQWDSRWMNHPTYLQYNQFPISNSVLAFEFDLQQEGSNQWQDSINWISPSNDVWRNRDYEVFPVADLDPAPSSASPPIFDATPGEGALNLELDTRQWNQNAPVNSAPFGIAAAEENSPGVPSTAQSTHSATGQASRTTGSEESMPPSLGSYVDSIGARDTVRRLRKKRKHSNVEDIISPSHCSRFNDISLTGTALEEELRRSTHWVSPDLYKNIVQNAQLLGVKISSQFDFATFPSNMLINKLCQLYFDHFHPNFPLLQKVAFQTVDEVWILVMAIAAIGAQYTPSAELAGFKGMLAHTVQRGLEVKIHGKISSSNTTSSDPFPGTAAVDDITVIQARILNSVIMIHSGNSSLMEKALSDFTALVAAARRMHLLKSGPRKTLVESNAIELQLRCRAGYMIWMLDFTYSYEFDQRHHFDLADAQAPLSCFGEIWKSYPTKENTTPGTSYTLSQALETLYTEKRLIDNLGEFDRVLLVQAICRQTIEVRQHARNRMSSWTPSATSQPGVRFQDTELWPPSSQTFSRWRNSACDCLDILHWSANSKIAQLAGFEHPTVLHLHLARLIILTPSDAIREFANTYVSGTRFHPEKDKSAYTVLQWSVRDQYKARLSVVHAAAIFWYIRRYSRNLFLEPFAAYLSTLVLWAFSIMVQIAQSQSHDIQVEDEQSSEEDSDFDLEFINLDRPCDDESVQTFVRRGHKVTANMARVGNICRAGAPKRILKQGIRVLGSGEEESVDAWGVAGGYVTELKRLISASKAAASSNVDKEH